MGGFTAKVGGALCMALAVSALAVDTADARRGGSFGSRGARTYHAPPPTRTSPRESAPIQRSMTAPPAQGQQAGARPATPAAASPGAAAPRRGGFLGGLGGGILGGLLVGGLIGGLMGHGFGTGAGAMMTILLQLAIAGLGVWLLMKLFRRRQQPAMAAAGWPAQNAQNAQREPLAAMFGAAAAEAPRASAPAASPSEDIVVSQADRAAFETLLSDVQGAFGREDYGALRGVTTPEIMSYLAEELSQNATAGRRNDVSAVRLLEADVAEAWREDDRDYATAALRYESIDLMRDRATGAILEGDADRPTETTELWTFVRPTGGAWKLSAIQEA